MNRCEACGAQLTEAKCSYCDTINHFSESINSDNKLAKKKKRPLHKKWWVWLIAFLFICVVVAEMDEADQLEPSINDDSSIIAEEQETADRPSVNQQENEQEVAVQERPSREGTFTLGDTFEFDGTNGLIEITFGTEVEWDVINNQFSEYDGETIFRIPVTITNIGDETGGLNMFNFTIFGSNGTSLSSISAFFDHDITWSGDMRPGATQAGYLHILYDGDGEYAIEFSNWSENAEVVFDIIK